jgi:phage tail tube protein FII
MEKKITRTFTNFGVTIKNSKNGEVVKTYTTDKTPDKKKVAITYIKETGNLDFIIEISETNETRAISVDDFMKYSEVVEPKENKQETTPDKQEG